MDKKPKRPRDVSQLAKMMVDIASGESVETAPHSKQKDPAAVARGRAGGLKGGAARVSSLTKSERVALSKKAAQSRWNSGKKS
jgi:hypothetical protein